MPIPLKAQDKATATLNAGISNSTLTIPLTAGQGTLFPNPVVGTATSGGSSTALNSTGIGASGVAVNDLIHNVTDDSWAVILTVSANAITTTALLGGTDNSWDNSDVWRVNEFVATLAAIDANGNDTKYEEVLVASRSTDTITVHTASRGYNSTTAQAFDAGDYFQLRVTAPYNEEMKKLLRDAVKQVNTNRTGIATNVTDIDNIESNATFYVAAAGSSNDFTGTLASMPAAYTTGERLYFKANHTISGSATFNRASLGAKTIKKLDGATNLASGDIASGQIVEIIYDGTNYIMLSPLGQVSGATMTNVGTVTADSASVGSSSTAENTMSPTWVGNVNIGSSKLSAAGAYAHIRLSGAFRINSSLFALRVKVGGTNAATFYTETATSAIQPFYIDLFITARTVGASAALLATGICTFGAAAATNQTGTGVTSGGTSYPSEITKDTTGTLDISVSAQFDASDATHACVIKNGTITIFNPPV